MTMKDKQVMERRTSSKELHLVACGYEKCAPEHSFGPTVRRYYTLHFILSGKGHLYIQDKHYTIHANQYFLISPDILTFYKADLEEPWTYVWLCFNGDSVPVMLQHCHIGVDTPIQQFLQMKDVKQIIFEMMNYPELTPANECRIQSGLYALFARLEESAHAQYSDSESNDNFYITQAMAYNFLILRLWMWPIICISAEAICLPCLKST